MGLLDFFRSKALTVSPEVLEIESARQLNLYQRLGGTNQQVVNAWEQAQSASYAWMYRTQPAVRTTVDYIAKNAAQLPLKLFERVGDNERQARSDHPAARTMRRPDNRAPAKRWIFNFVADFLLYDNAYAIKFAGADGTRTLVRIPPHMMALIGESRFTVDGYRVHRYDGTTFPENGMMLPPEQVLHWVGYDPDDSRKGVSHLETLRQVLAEESAAVTANTELLKSGLQKNGWIYRPTEAPQWSNEAREFFEQDLYNRVTRSDKRWPVLEEGMEIRDLGITPKDAEMLAGRRFTLETVAREYGMENVPPADEEERKQFYTDVLSPLVEELAEVLDVAICQEEYAGDDLYFEFDLNEKLRGDPIQRFQAITAAVGAPWLVRNEARAMENRPAVDGGDDLIVPLNVIKEGEQSPRQPAPNVMPPQDPNEVQRGRPAESSAESQRKALTSPRRALQLERRNRYKAELEAIFKRFYERQERVVVKGQKAFEADRWNRELAADLEKAINSIVEREGDVAAQRFGLAAFDTRAVKNYLKAAAEDVAKNVNDTTRAELTEANAQDVFKRARDERAQVAALSLAGRMTTFAGLEAAKQSPDALNRTKTWVVTSSNSAHPELDGETVPLGATFSNGSDGPPAEHAGCQCALEIT